MATLPAISLSPRLLVSSYSFDACTFATRTSRCSRCPRCRPCASGYGRCRSLLRPLRRERVRHRPADAADVFVVDRALVVGVVLLGRADQRIHARRIDVVGDLALHDPHVVAVAFPHAGNAAFDRLGLFQRPHHFVVARRIERNRRTAGGDRAEDRHAFVALVFPVLVFLLVLEVRADRNRNRQDAEARALRGESPEAAGRGQRPDPEQQSQMRWSLILPSRVLCPNRRNCCRVLAWIRSRTERRSIARPIADAPVVR